MLIVIGDQTVRIAGVSPRGQLFQQAAELQFTAVQRCAGWPSGTDLIFQVCAGIRTSSNRSAACGYLRFTGSRQQFGCRRRVGSGGPGLTRPAKVPILPGTGNSRRTAIWVRVGGWAFVKCTVATCSVSFCRGSHEQVLSVLAPGGAGRRSRRCPRADGDPKQWNQTVDKALAYLKSTQAADGSWSRDNSPGVTGVVLTGLLRTGRSTARRRDAGESAQVHRELINPKAGHIAGKDPKAQLQNYVTSVNVMALPAANRPDKYKAVIGDAAKFLKKLQWDEGEGKTPDDDFYGGAGYDSKSRPDLSNTQFFLDALKAAGVPQDDPAYKKALIVRQPLPEPQERVQRPAVGRQDQRRQLHLHRGRRRRRPRRDDPPTAPARLRQHDLRRHQEHDLLRRVEGRPADEEGARLDARRTTRWTPTPACRRHSRSAACTTTTTRWPSAWTCWAWTSSPTPTGVKHDWRADITAALAKRQQPDGSWVNETDRWMEGDPNLVTGYALMALSHCKPKK